MKKISLKLLVDRIQQVVLRFPITLFFLLGLAFLFFLSINKQEAHIQPYAWAFFAVGISLSLATTLLLETTKNLFVKFGLNVLSVILLLAYVYTLPDKLMPVHYYQLIILGLVFALSAFFVSFVKPDNNIPFWEFSKTVVIQFLISAVFAQVLMLGLSLAILSLKELFKVDVQHEVYRNLAVICYVLFLSIYFLTNIPDEVDKQKQRYSFPTFLKILGLYILLPILALYSFILYVYLIQIIIKWELPNGWVSTLVSILGLGGFFCMLIIYPLRLEDKKRNKVVNVFSSYFSVLLLPLLILMSIGIFRRFGDYGLTINRCYVLILNIWLYGISIYLFVTKANHLKWIVISFAVVALCSSVGPWSVFSVTERTLTKEIGHLLKDTKLLKNGKAIDNSKRIVKVDSLSAQKISEDIRYISTNFGTNSIQAYFNDSIRKLDAWEIFESLGIDKVTSRGLHPRKYKGAEPQYFNMYQDFNNEIIDIGLNYKYLVLLHRSNEQKKLFNNKTFVVNYLNNSIEISDSKDKNKPITIPLKSKIKDLMKWDKKQKPYSTSVMTIDGQNYKLLINNITGFYYQNSDSVTITEMSASLFLK